MSWVTLDRICQEKVDKEGVRSELVRNGRPLRSSAEPLPLRPAARLAPPAGNIARTVKVGRNAPCSCGSGKKFKKCCGSPAEAR